MRLVHEREGDVEARPVGGAAHAGLGQHRVPQVEAQVGLQVVGVGAGVEVEHEVVAAAVPVR